MHLAATQCKDILRELQRSYIFKHFLVSKILTTMFDIDFRWFDTFLRFEIVNILYFYVQIQKQQKRDSRAETASAGGSAGQEEKITRHARRGCRFTSEPEVRF